MVKWLNAHRKSIQYAVLIGGLLVIAAVFLQGRTAGNVGPHGRVFDYRQLDPAYRMWRRMAGGTAKPALVGACLLVALYAVRIFLKWLGSGKQLPAVAAETAKQHARWLFRLLQIIHVPLAIVVAVAAATHGLITLLRLWAPNMRSWSGIAALVALAVTVVLGTSTVWRRRDKGIHRVTAIIAFALVLVHVTL